jgi:hypothetical protein
MVVMGARLLTFACFYILVAGVGSPAQDEFAGRTDAYSVCIAKIRNAPQDAYDPCRHYLEESPSDDAKRTQWVKNWVTRHEKLRPYAQFLRNLTTDQKAAWIIYEPDIVIQLPQTSEEEGPYKIQIARSFADRMEEVMLTKAEAVYPGPEKMIQDLFRSYGPNQLPKEMAPLWGIPGNDNIESTTTVTARAVRYYYDLSLAARRDPALPTGFTAMGSSLKYTAGIKYFNQYSHGEDTFQRVYVADLTLEWGFVCGGLCGMGFTRNKVVVLDSQGDVIAMYLDAPVNSESWVS